MKQYSPPRLTTNWGSSVRRRRIGCWGMVNWSVPSFGPANGSISAGVPKKVPSLIHCVLTNSNCRTSSSIHGFHDLRNVGFEVGARLLEVLLVKAHVLPLSVRILRRGIDRAIDQRDDMLEREPLCDIRDAEIRRAEASIGVMAREAPYDRASPIMSDSNRLIYSEIVEKVEHVLHRMLDRVVLVTWVDARPTVAAHVWRDRAKAERPEARQLMAPANRELGPSVHKNDQWSVFGATGEIEARVARRLDGIVGDRICHGLGSLGAAVQLVLSAKLCHCLRSLFSTCKATKRPQTAMDHPCNVLNAFQTT